MPRRFYRLRARLDPWAGRIVGALLGCAAGWYGAAAGFLLGVMVDSARRDRRLLRHFRDPGTVALEGSLPGMADVAALAFLPSWPGPSGAEERRQLLLVSAREVLRREAAPAVPVRARDRASGTLQDILGKRHIAFLAEASSVAMAEVGLPFDSLARDLALKGGPVALALLPAYAYGLCASAGTGLSHEAEAVIVSALADSGCPASLVAAARQRAFPGYQDPWELLGVPREAGLGEIKRAWRRMSRSYHPDLAGEVGAGDFRNLRSAYEFLKARQPG